MSEVAVGRNPGDDAISEIREYVHSRDERRRLLPRSLVVGLASGVIAVAFRSALDGGDHLRAAVVRFAHSLPQCGLIVPMIFSAFGAVAALFVVRHFAKETSGSGIPHLEGVLRRHKKLNWARVLPAKFVGGVVSIGAGLALGREGPTVQMGGATGMGIARLLKSTRRETLILTAAGAGAGLAAAFNAPLSGLVFVLEELQRDFRPTVFGAAFVAAATADIVTRVVAGQMPVFNVPAYAAPSLWLLPAFLALGVVSGLFGVAFNKGLIKTLDAFGRLSGKSAYFGTAIVGAAIGFCAYLAPTTVGGGHDVAHEALMGELAFTSVLGLLCLRFAMTLGSYGTGVAGGIFAPLLCLGSLLGLGVGQVTQHISPSLVANPGVFGVVGMAALFTAIVRAPLTGIVLIVEMTSSYAQMLPLLVACFASYATAEALKDLPIYEALLQRDLLKGGASPNSNEAIVMEVQIEPGSPFDGRTVRELGLPSGVVIVLVEDGEEERVPHAGTRLNAHERVTAIVSPESVGGETALRSGASLKE